MKVAEELGVDFLLVKSDSQLVINQLFGVYQAKGDNMVAYLKKVQEVAARFKGMKMEQIPREESSSRCPGQDSCNRRTSIVYKDTNPTSTPT
ncbi:hypothetical protein LWI29_030748 [Acer saccharum]|uniref:RNase H type-1 domain-containing protein n=1 Tax=Acer saccharum TaxID=4024 RepID=A0AA39ULA4_ACESA|nr:hypothetical protein LWI29_030748 [Acer saccharum]